MNKKIKTIINNWSFYYDYYILYFLFNQNKIDVYHRFMSIKWKDKFLNHDERNN